MRNEETPGVMSHVSMSYCLNLHATWSRDTVLWHSNKTKYSAHLIPREVRRVKISVAPIQARVPCSRWLKWDAPCGSSPSFQAPSIILCIWVILGTAFSGGDGEIQVSENNWIMNMQVILCQIRLWFIFTFYVTYILSDQKASTYSHVFWEARALEHQPAWTARDQYAYRANHSSDRMPSQQPSTPKVPKYLKTKEMITDDRRAEGRMHPLLHIHLEVNEDLKLLKSSVSKDYYGPLTPHYL